MVAPTTEIAWTAPIWTEISIPKPRAKSRDGSSNATMEAARAIVAQGLRIADEFLFSENPSAVSKKCIDFHDGDVSNIGISRVPVSEITSMSDHRDDCSGAKFGE